MIPLEVTTEQANDGSWTVYVGHVAVRPGLTESEADSWAAASPEEVVRGTRWEHDYRNRAAARERIAGIPSDEV